MGVCSTQVLLGLPGSVRVNLRLVRRQSLQPRGQVLIQANVVRTRDDLPVEYDSLRRKLEGRRGITRLRFRSATV